MLKIKEKLLIDYKNLFVEVIFILIISILFYNSNFIYINESKIKFIVIIILSILFMNLYNIIFNKKCKCNVENIKENGNSFWIVIYSTVITLIVNNLLSDNINIWIPYVLNLLLLFIVFKVCKTKLKNFTYKTNFFWIIAMLIIAYFLLIIGLKDKSNYYNIINFLAVVIINLISNYGLEEIIYRGCTFNGLVKTKLNYVQINIIQSIIFAISHLSGFGHDINSIPYYILFGYLLGKIYITSNSLTPGILLHGIFNMY